MKVNTAKIVADQRALYPCLEVQDIVKALYQEQFGCGHLVSESADGLNWLENEARTANVSRENTPALIESLGEKFCRVHLAPLAQSGLNVKTLYALFVLSGSTSCGDMNDFIASLDALENMNLPSGHEFLAKYRAAGCPAAHHSEAFRAAYAPAYRVIRSDYAALIPLLAKTDLLLAKQERVTLAIEGRSASGKSSLAGLLSKIYDCNVFHMDDFFLQPHQRTPERFAQPGGNVDRERVLAEVLEPLAKGGAFEYRVFDCSAMALGETIRVTPKRLNIVEGAYSMHTELASCMDLSVFIDIDADKQKDRILKRNGPDMLKRFVDEWIPMEEAYMQKTSADTRCNLKLQL